MGLLMLAHEDIQGSGLGIFLFRLLDFPVWGGSTGKGREGYGGAVHQPYRHSSITVVAPDDVCFAIPIHIICSRYLPCRQHSRREA